MIYFWLFVIVLCPYCFYMQVDPAISRNGMNKVFCIFPSKQPLQTGQQVSPILKRCHQVLDPLTRAVPGLMEGLYLIAKVKYLAGRSPVYICYCQVFCLHLLLTSQRLILVFCIMAKAIFKNCAVR